MRPELGSLRTSLRVRLLVGTLAWIIGSVLLAGWVLTDLFARQLARQLNAELVLHTNQLVAELEIDAQGVASLESEPSDERFQRPLAGLYWQIDQLDADGSVQASVLHSRSLWDQTLQQAEPPRFDATTGLENLGIVRDVPVYGLARVVTPPEGEAAYRILLASDREAVTVPLARYRLMLTVALGLLAAGLTAAALVQVLLGLRPLASLRRGLEAIHQGRATRIEGRFPSEIQPLVNEFNAVLHESNAVLARARTQAGDLAHALKTPLAVLANSAAGQDTPFGQLVGEQVDLARRQVEHHLARARALAAVRTPGVRTELAPVLEALVRVLARLHADKGLALHVAALPAGLAFAGAEPDLQEMLGNLLDNACKWARSEVWVTAVAPAAGAAALLELRVEDDGPGLPAEQRVRIFERAVRMDERVPGSGLGLAIVRDLAQAYGGSVQAAASPRGGLAVRLRLPVLASASVIPRTRTGARP